MKGINIKRRSVRGAVGIRRVRSKLIGVKAMVGNMEGHIVTVAITQQKVKTQ